MKLIKHINNNFAVAEDASGNTVIVQGKGIGFGVLPRELTSFEGVVRTYYNIDSTYFDIIREIPNDIISLSGKVIDKAVNDLDCELSPNIVFTLADHINFSIERYKKGITIKPFMLNDIKFLYEKEYAIGVYALDLLKKELHEYLPKEEAAFIALHIINSKLSTEDRELSYDIILTDIVNIIENKYNLKINKDNFNFSRFASHMDFFLKRVKYKEILQTKNEKLFDSVKNEYVEAYECVEEIADYFRQTLQIELSKEEKLYLILHINKLCDRETNGR